MGPELMVQLRAQAERFGARLETDQAERVQLASGSDPAHPGVHSVWVGDTEHRARTVILAMGAEHKRLGVPGEQELGGRGVSYCATCDAAFFKDAPTLIVGGGDSRDGGGDLPLQVRLEGRDRAPPRRVSRLEDHARAGPRAGEHRVAHSVHRRVVPAPARAARWAARGCVNTETGEQRDLEISGAFIAIGHEPQSELVRGQIEIDENGYVRTEGRSTRTNRPGVFAAGDLVDHTYRQAITAAGSGCQAALDAEWYLRDTPEVPTPEGMPEGDLAEAQWAPAQGAH